MATNTADLAGRVLLLFATRDTQTAEQVAAGSGMGPGDVARELYRLTEQGFIVAGSEGDLAVYRLNPKGVRTEASPTRKRLLVVDDADALRRLMLIFLEDEGYAVIAVALPADAAALLREVEFDLVLTDSFSGSVGGVYFRTVEVIEAAGATPVALFSGHRIELEPAQAAGFAAVIEKPFDIDILAQQIRTLLGSSRPPV